MFCLKNTPYILLLVQNKPDEIELKCSSTELELKGREVIEEEEQNEVKKILKVYRITILNNSSIYLLESFSN